MCFPCSEWFAALYEVSRLASAWFASAGGPPNVFALAEVLGMKLVLT